MEMNQPGKHCYSFISMTTRQEIVSVFTCQPIPRLRIEGGSGVALAYLDTAMKTPVDCSEEK